jgi:YHS domain-containing protein
VSGASARPKPARSVAASRLPKTAPSAGRAGLTEIKESTGIECDNDYLIDPKEYPAMQATDPVCGMQIDSTRADAKETVQGQTYYFCSKYCHDEFRAAPERYVKRGEARESYGSQSTLA